MIPKYLQKVKAVICFYILHAIILFACVSVALAENKPKPYLPNLFSSVPYIPSNDRVRQTQLIYKKNCRKMSEADAMRNLDDLDKIARTTNDLPLECAVFDMRADYYSVNRRFNTISTEYYDKAILFAEEHNMPLENAVYLHRKAIYYFIYKQNISACRYFLFAQEKFKEIGYNKVPDIGTYFLQLASFYYSIDDFYNARINLNHALRYKPTSPADHINIVNTIGLTYRNSKQYDKAMPYFIRALAMATSKRDSVWISITQGNIGSVYFLKHQYDKALPLITIDYEQSLKYKQLLNAAIAMLRLVEISMASNNIAKTDQQLRIADSLLSITTDDVSRYKVELYRLHAELGEKTGNLYAADNYRKLMDVMKDSVAARDNTVAVERVRLQWEIERSRAQLSKVKTNAELGKVKRNAIILVLLLLVVISILLYNRQRLKAAKDRELLASEKRRLDEELRNAALALYGYTENLTQKNLLIEDFKTKIEQLQGNFTDKDGAEQLTQMMRSHIMTDENWEEFKKLFNKAHPAFFYRLRNRFANLTGTDTRLLALIKLNLTNREMAGMLGITTDGVKKAKQRLRKKMELETGIEIEDVIIKL